MLFSLYFYKRDVFLIFFIRYYLGEDPFGGSIYGREKGYENSRPHGRHRTPGRSGIETEYR